MGYPLVNIQKAIENGHRNSGFTMIYPSKMVIFHSYVKLPEGKPSDGGKASKKGG